MITPFRYVEVSLVVVENDTLSPFLLHVSHDELLVTSHEQFDATETDFSLIEPGKSNSL